MIVITDRRKSCPYGVAIYNKIIAHYELRIAN